MTVLTVPASFLPSAMARLTASGAAPADRRDALAVLAAILADLEPQSFTSARNAESTAELLGLDPAAWSRTIRLLEDAGAVVRVKRRGRRGIAVTPDRAAQIGRPRDSDAVILRA